MNVGDNKKLNIKEVTLQHLRDTQCHVFIQKSFFYFNIEEHTVFFSLQFVEYEH